MSGHLGFVRHADDLLLAVGSALTLAGGMLNLFAVTDGAERHAGLPLRVRFVEEYRRHPRLRGGSIACLLVALIAYVWYFVALLG